MLPKWQEAMVLEPICFPNGDKIFLNKDISFLKTRQMQT